MTGEWERIYIKGDWDVMTTKGSWEQDKEERIYNEGVKDGERLAQIEFGKEFEKLHNWWASLTLTELMSRKVDMLQGSPIVLVDDPYHVFEDGTM
jgi:hypothetical protein